MAITGLGPLTSVGTGVEPFRRALENGASGGGPITSFDTTGFDHFNGCEVRDFVPADWVHRLDPCSLGRASQFSIAAAHIAVDDAGIEIESLANRSCGVVIGTTEGECQAIEQLTQTGLRSGMENLDRELIRQVPANRLSLAVAHEFSIEGEAVTIGTACSAGNYAIGYAYDLIALGESDVMICGGADIMSRKTFAGFYRLGTIAPNVCQPFDKNRRGILTGEGAGIMILENLESARRRGARIYAEILGYGMTEDATHPVVPDQESIARCMRLAHQNAGIEPSQVDFISAHGTGTVANDMTEAAAIREVFGERRPPVTALKSMIGHTMGAASALAGIACVLGLYGGFIPPTIHCEQLDTELGMDCVLDRPRAAEVNIVQNNGFAFGGNNAIVIIGKFRD